MAYVHDGDTLWLADGAKVRIIGLNAPEVARGQRPAEPLADRARNALRRAAAGRVGLEYDEEREDRYGRVLAHVYSEARVNLTAGLIAQGLAHAVSYPPNLKHRRCYQEAEREAREAGVGVWMHSYFDPVAAKEVNRGGFMRVKGCVKSTKNTRKTTRFRLAENFLLKVSRIDFDDVFRAFPRPASEFSGACLIVRGWVYNDRRSGKRILTLHHSDNVEIVRFP